MLLFYVYRNPIRGYSRFDHSLPLDHALQMGERGTVAQPKTHTAVLGSATNAIGRDTTLAVGSKGGGFFERIVYTVHSVPRKDGFIPGHYPWLKKNGSDKIPSFWLDALDPRVPRT
jgi:hypothetical protein